MPSQLKQLESMTTIVADSGDFESIKSFVPTDATTNPSLVFQAAQKREYRELVEKAVALTQKSAVSDKSADLIDTLFVTFGIELLKIIPGRVSTEVDASLSFDTQATIDRARHIIELYENHGIPRDRVLIKIAATWEGIRACEMLEMENIHCNMTLIFSPVQAIGSMQAKATLISPFVGRILDWHKKQDPTAEYTLDTDPGVVAVRTIYNYAKKFGHTTQIMGASFRNTEEIRGLAGCDLLTISPKLLAELNQATDPIEHKLSIENAQKSDIEKLTLSESSFRYLLNDNAMATEKLAEGIRGFVKDTHKLEQFVCQEFNM